MAKATRLLVVNQHKQNAHDLMCVCSLGRRPDLFCVDQIKRDNQMKKKTKYNA